jgi:DNA-binding response OmpR family regulator
MNNIKQPATEKKLLDISEPGTLSTDNKQNEKIKVLIIEDDPLLGNLLSAKFAKSNIIYQFCRNGSDAMNMILQFKPTVIILDIMLPGKNGLDVLKEIREYNELIDLPVIIFSNKDNDADRKLARSLGSDTFLVKAMTDLNELVNIILKKQKIS